MDYPAIVSITQSAALVFFVVLFAAVVAYALWPGNKQRFERAARLPLDHGADAPRSKRSKI
ncbi:MAG: cbb3-type cytochrome c oxidase subunit 3 [Hyphomicrobiales bacterium]